MLSQLTRNRTSLLQLQISCILTKGQIWLINRFSLENRQQRNYNNTHNIQKLLLQLMALEHGQKLQLTVNRHNGRRKYTFVENEDWYLKTKFEMVPNSKRG